MNTEPTRGEGRTAPCAAPEGGRGTRSWRYITCPCCGEKTRLPVVWMLGVEVVFACGACGAKLKTGYKMGALLSALGLVGALVTANLGVWLFSSFTLPFFVAVVIPLWLVYGFLARREWLLRKYRQKAPAGTRKD